MIVNKVITTKKKTYKKPHQQSTPDLPVTPIYTAY